ncbi:MAG: hypothetical protein K0Q70_559 [Rhodospirillales bacterium]|jgi:hypothetical protein|nr:hypothetical protein [Rhodospirillales bacterium]
MDCSWFQCLKLEILSAIPLTRDEMHALIGAIVFVSILPIDRRRPIWSIAAVIVVAFTLETIDLVDDVTSRGTPRWGASLHDIQITLVLPLMLAGLYHVGRRLKTGGRRS